ncbi:MAG: hypothetical protein AAGA56_01750 [Myxococcota bacterium]
MSDDARDPLLLHELARVKPKDVKALRARWGLAATTTNLLQVQQTLAWLERLAAQAPSHPDWRTLSRVIDLLGLDPDIERTMPANLPAIAVEEARPASSPSASSAPLSMTMESNAGWPAIESSSPTPTEAGARSGFEPHPETQPAVSWPRRRRGGTAPGWNELDLDRYAALCAWTERHPDRRQTIHERHGIASETIRTAIDEAFRNLWVTDPEAEREFERRLAFNRTWLDEVVEG